MKKLIIAFCLTSVFAVAQTKPATKPKTAAKKETKTEAAVMPDHKAEYVGGNAGRAKYMMDNLK